MKPIHLKLMVLVLCCSLFFGCATAERSLRSEPASYFAVPDLKPEGVLEGLVHLTCVRERKTERRATNGECLYIAADIGGLLARLPGDEETSPLRESALGLLLSVSDYNCSNFLHRAFAVRSTFDGASKLTGDITTGASALTAAMTPGVSAALDAINLLVGKADQNFNSTFFFEKTFQALEASIEAERSKRKADILARKVTDGYSLADALSDVRRYDDACSIKMGLQSLSNTAEEAKKESKALQDAVQSETNKDKKMNYIRNYDMQGILSPDPVKKQP